MTKYVSSVAYNELEDAKKILTDLSTKYKTASITKKKYNNNCAKLKDSSGDSIRQSIINGANDNVNAYAIYEYQLRSNIKVKAKLNIFEDNKLILSAWLKDESYKVKPDNDRNNIPSRSEVFEKCNINVDNLKIDKEKSKQIYNCLVNKHLKAKKYKHNFKKIYLKIQQLAEELKIEADNLENIISTYEELDKTKDSVKGSQTVASPIGKTLTVKDLRKKIKEALKEGKIKKANNLYAKLKKKVGKEKAREIAKKLIEKTGATVKLKKGDFVAINSKNKSSSAEAESTAAIITTAAAPVTADFIAYAKKRDTADIEAMRKGAKANLYDEISEKINAIDPNAENATELLEQYQEEQDRREVEIDLYYDGELEKLNNNDYSTDYYANMTQEEINKDLAASKESAQVNYVEKVQSGGAYSYNLDQKATEIKNAVALKESQNNSVPSTNNNPSSNTQESEVVASPVTPSNTQNVEANSKPSPSPTPSQSTNVSSSAPKNNTPTQSTTGSSSVQNVTTTESSVETPDMPGDQSDPDIFSETGEAGNNTTSSGEEVISVPSSEESSSSNVHKKSGLSTAIPVGLGVAATGAAAVAGVRYFKNKKQNEDIDDSYDDENNDLSYSSTNYGQVPSDSAYMRDDYLDAQDTNTTTDTPSNGEYTDTEQLEEAAGTQDFFEDIALNDLN